MITNLQNEKNVNENVSSNVLIALIEKESLLEVVNIALSVVSKKSPMTVLSNVFLSFKDNMLTISSTNLETLIIQKIQVECYQNFECLVKANVFYDILKQTVGENIKFYGNQKEINIVDDCGEFKLINSTEKFPQRNIDQFESILSLESKDLIDLIKQTNINVDSNEGGSMNLEIKNKILSCIISDRRRFSYIEQPIDSEKEYKLSINPKLRKELTKLNNKHSLEIKVWNQEFIIQTSHIILLSRVYNAISIDYRNFLQKNETPFSFTCSTKDLSKALSRVITLSSILTRSIKIDFFKDKLELSSFDPSAGSSKSTLQGSGDFEDTVYINGDYLIDAIHNASTEEVHILFQNKNKHLIFECGAKHIIMPIRV